MSLIAGPGWFPAPQRAPSAISAATMHADKPFKMRCAPESRNAVSPNRQRTLSPLSLVAPLTLESILDLRNHDDAAVHWRTKPALCPRRERGLRPGFHLGLHGLAEPAPDAIPARLDDTREYVRSTPLAIHGMTGPGQFCSSFR